MHARRVGGVLPVGGVLSAHVDLFFLFLPVAHPQDPHHPSEKPAIHCHKCGEPCKGEVLRVQTKHFHIKCFTCKGMASGFPAPWHVTASACLEVRPAPSPHHVTGGRVSMLRSQQSLSVPRVGLGEIQGANWVPQHRGGTGLWVFTEVPGAWRWALIRGEQ